MQFWKKRLQRVAAMVCSVALVASMMPTAAFATEPEPTPTPEPTPVVETTPTPEPSESPVSTDATVSTSAPDADADSTAAPEATPAGNTDDTPAPSEKPVEQQVKSVPQTLAAAPAANDEPEVSAARTTPYTIYNDPEKGIDISVDQGDALIPKTAHFVVIVDGVTVHEEDVGDLKAAGTTVTIIADNYKVNVGTETGNTFAHTSGNIYTLVPTWDNKTATIELTSFKTHDDISIADEEGNNYGTFSWMKGNATNDDFERTLTVEVNGEEKYYQTVYTPQTLNNALGQPSQFWFTPGPDYNEEYEIKPQFALDTLANRDLTVKLTTKCPCGNIWCECPGGTGCTCEEGCKCDLCAPGEEDRQIKTNYATIGYREAIAAGYNLTVETYVNGTLVDTQSDLRVSSGLPNCLNFEPAAGYYYYNDQNSYDIITKNPGSSWDQRTGELNIMGALQEDRDFNNVLKVYLWTFSNHLTLDVNRDLGDPMDHVKGYTITFDAVDPATGETKTYTYEATSFAGAQQQMIPFGTKVTITPICDAPYEVAQWSTGAAYTGGITLTGSEGQSKTEAYGNKATLYVDNTAYDGVILEIDSLRKVEVPTEDELDDPDAPYFDGNVAVVVDCVNESAQHKSESFKLMADRFTVSELKGDSASGYYAEVTITNPQAYVDTYNAMYQNYTHTLSESQDKLVITLRWVVENKESVWKADDPATIKVTCEEETPDIPDVDVEDLGGEVVTIKCTNTETSHPEMKSAILGVLNTDYSVDYGTDRKTATITINRADKYVDAYNKEHGKPQHTASQISDAKIKVNYDENAKQWTVDETDSTATVDVTCQGTAKESVALEKTILSVERDGNVITLKDDEMLKVGDELTYAIDIVNSGNVDLEKLTVTDTFNGHFAPSAVKDAAGQELSATWTESEGSWQWKYEIAELKVDAIATYTYTYTVNQADAGNTLTNTAVVTGDELDPENPPEDKDEHEVTNDGDITLRPADITIYMGGKDGYAGAAGGDSNSLPEPGFYITLPADVENALKTELGLENGAAADLSKIITGVTATTADGHTRSWTMQMYGESASTAWINNREHFVYRIVPGENQPAISVNFTNEDGTPVTEDKFTLTDSLSETYFMSLNTASVDVETISLTFNIKGEIFHCGYDAKESKPGTLTVRYASEEHDTTKAVTNGNEIDTDNFGLLVEDGQKFNINQKDAGADGVDVTAEDVSLLVDSLVGGEDYAYTSELYSKAVTAAGFKSSGVWGQYLDLVDAENGNAWLTPEGEVTVFWPYPAGVTKDTGTIKLYHFEGLDRDMATGDVMAEINNTDAVEVQITRLDDGFTFKTSSFSPFVLVQDTTQPSGGEDKPTGGDDGNNDNNNNNTNTNNNTTTVNVTSTAAAQPQAATAAIPQTGDAMPVGLLGGLAAAAAAGFAALFVIRKRKQNG